jgi:hypothetical protein
VTRAVSVLLLMAGVAVGADAPRHARSRPSTRELPAEAAQERALLEAAGPGFELLRTAHFLIAYDVGAADVRPFVSRVEQTYRSIYRFCRVNGIEAAEPETKLEVLYFHAYDAYERYGRRVHFPAAGTYGFYHEITNRSAFFDVTRSPTIIALREQVAAAGQQVAELDHQLEGMRRRRTPITFHYANGQTRTLTPAQAEEELARLRRDLRTVQARMDNYGEQINRTVVQHETAHQVFFNAGVHVRGAENPLWLVEGLAMLFETPLSGRGSGIGAVNQLRLRDLREAVAGDASDPHITTDEMLAAMRNGPLVPLETMIRTPDVLTTRGNQGAVYYAEAWSLLHFLHRTRRKELAAYIQIAGRRKPGERITPDRQMADFEEAFGPIDEAFLRRWAGYVLSIGMKAAP